MKDYKHKAKNNLIHDIQKTHNKIFSMPANRYIFCIIDDFMIGAAGFGYIYVDEQDNGVKKKVIAIEYKNLCNFKFQLDDLLVIVYCNKMEKCNSKFFLKKESLNKDFPPHISIITQCDFLHYREYVNLYRECLESYTYNA